MTVNDMHISVQQGVDKLTSMQSDLILPEEIDLELNKNIQRFVNQKFSSKSNRYQEGFEESQKRIDDLRTLLVEESLQCLYKGEVFKGIFSETASLPDNYMHLVNLKTLVSIQKCKKMCYDTDDSYPLTKAKLKYNVNNGCTPISFGPGIELFAKDTSGTWVSITVPTDASVNTVGMVTTWILQPANWKEGVTITSGSQGVFIVELPLFGFSGEGYFLYHNGTSQVGCVAGVTTEVYAQTASKRIACTDPDLDTTTLVGQNKFAQHDDIFALLSDPFNITTYESPLYTIRDTSLDIYTDDTFIINRAKITYLKRPAIVDNVASTTVDCDLPEITHHEIVQMTINSILEGISDPRYQSTNMEVLKSE
jgi:hypothetical protein